MNNNWQRRRHRERRNSAMHACTACTDRCTAPHVHLITSLHGGCKARARLALHRCMYAHSDHPPSPSPPPPTACSISGLLQPAPCPPRIHATRCEHKHRGWPGWRSVDATTAGPGLTPSGSRVPHPLRIPRLHRAETRPEGAARVFPPFWKLFHLLIPGFQTRAGTGEYAPPSASRSFSPPQRFAHNHICRCCCRGGRRRRRCACVRCPRCGHACLLLCNHRHSHAPEEDDTHLA